MRRAFLGLATASVAVIAAALGVNAIRAVETCVGVYEDAGGAGDTLLTCAVGATNVHQGNLSTVTTGLHNGCNRGINQSSSWSDCISSIRYTSLPANYAVKFYRDSGYVGLLWCRDADGNSGTLNVPGNANDLITSFRIVGGNCA